MVANRKVTGKAMSVLAGVSVGAGICVLITLAGSLIIAWLVGADRLPESGFGYGAMVTLLGASVAGAWAAATLVKHQRLMVCLLTGGIYFLLLLSLTTFCFGGQYQGIVPTALLIAGGSMTPALFGAVGQGNRTSRRHKYRSG